jgi:GT2 family glycosyltransferase
MTAEHPAVTVVIPNYNGRRLLEQNLPCVLGAAADYPGHCAVIVVDDASTEAGSDTLAAAFPSVTVLRHRENRGFADAVRTGVDAAATEVLVLLNTDVAPARGFLAPLTRALGDPQVFAVSPLMFNDDGSPIPHSWNRRVFRRGKLVRVALDEALALTAPVKSLYATGGAAALRKSMFEALGGFADLYKPFYSEDLDLGVRAWRRGWKTLFEPASRVTHQHSGTIRTHYERAIIKRSQHRNTLLFEWSHLSTPRLLLYRAPYYVKQLIGRAFAGDSEFLLGFGDALKRIGQARAHRRTMAAGPADFQSVLRRVNAST